MIRSICAVMLIVGATMHAGCSSDPTKGYAPVGVFPTGVRSIAVPIFTNRTYSRDVEFELTDALIKQIESQTPYKVMSQADADTVLTGQIRNIQLDHLSKSRQTGLTEEVIVSVTIDFQWKDARSGRVLVERRSFAGHGLFVPSRPTGEPIELGTSAAVQQLARDVVAELQAQW
jgi:hypothetical protein